MTYITNRGLLAARFLHIFQHTALIEERSIMIVLHRSVVVLAGFVSLVGLSVCTK